jgi:hypothetical protein
MRRDNATGYQECGAKNCSDVGVLHIQDNSRPARSASDRQEGA